IMKPPYPSLTPTWHNDVYPAIEYSNPNVSHEGHTIIITGAGGGIGRETAIGYATARAKHLVLVGLTKSKLEETAAQASKANPYAKISIFDADVTDEAAMAKVAGEVGTWDAVVFCAGWMPTPSPVAKSDISDFWKSYEVNVKAIAVMVKAFLPTASPTYAAFLAMISAGSVFPAQMLVGYAGYQVAKVAAAKMIEILAEENPNVFFAAVHPGMVETDGFRKSGYTTDMLAMDDVKLPAGFSLWASLPEAKFLTGRFIWANWDIEELKGMREEIVSGTKLLFGYNSWPFPNM
ncbi:short chain dehydrogenase, partial [Lindgomyces ingoldianus]